MMDSNIDSSIAEEEHIRTYETHPNPKETRQKRLKYASMREIKNYERIAQNQNHRMLQDHPTLFQIDSHIASKIHLVCTKTEQYFLEGENRHPAIDAVERSSTLWEMRVPLSNINRQSNLRIELGRLRPGRSISIQNRRIGNGKAIRYRYSLTLADKNLLLRVWVELDGIFKIWKQMEVPQGEGRILLEVSEFNSEQTDVKLNDFLFHLVLKMPFQHESQYCILFDETVQIEKVELTITSQGKILDEMDTNCSKECQLI